MDRLEPVSLADYFARKLWPRLEGRLPAKRLAERGERLGEAGGCTACREERTHASRIAEDYDHVLKSIEEYRASKRTRRPKNALLGPLADADFDALSPFGALRELRCRPRCPRPVFDLTKIICIPGRSGAPLSTRYEAFGSVEADGALAADHPEGSLTVIRLKRSPLHRTGATARSYSRFRSLGTNPAKLRCTVLA
jgi:cytochrome c553